MPESPEEVRAALGRYMMPVRFCLTGVSNALEAAGVKPLTPDEHKEGTEVWAGVCYENNIAFSFTVLAVLWTIGMVLPRATEFIREWRKQRSESLTATNVAAATEKARDEYNRTAGGTVVEGAVVARQ